ncbi:hypothetical protein KP509_03G046000 [Ceratopteris richardii]|uniref:Uncharacterized protein n=1 Tax=Ceratopteris richardii TaxID=49495 RepID=A0A8T2V3N4_CERRI|nr:hypothetical protein KP509_03G046000 [Ceratopteris richardii]
MVILSQFFIPSLLSCLVLEQDSCNTYAAIFSNCRHGSPILPSPSSP